MHWRPANHTPMAKTKTIIAQILCLVFVIADTWIRPPFTIDNFYYGNFWTLLLLSIIPFLIMKRDDAFFICTLVGIMIYNLLDGIYSDIGDFGRIDQLMVLFAYALLLGYFVVKRRTIRIDPAIVLLILAIPVKLYCANTYEMIGTRYVMSMGDATIRLLLAGYCFMRFKGSDLSIAFILLAATFINFEDNTIGDPIDLHRIEIIVIAAVLLNIAWYHLRKWNARGSFSTRSFIIEATVLTCLLLLTAVLPIWSWLDALNEHAHHRLGGR